ncbi:MAG: type II toxin-antitoxin system VapC family toxin [Anaerolineales bacterium]|nr:type II toxin-antitoxin system VapC family toxin [Anaerolineales bacterium]
MAIIVIDASIIVNLLVEQPLSNAAKQWMRTQQSLGAQFYAPAHWIAEVASALRFAVFSQVLDAEDAKILIGLLPELPLATIIPNAEMLRSSLEWAKRLGQSKAYDSQYLALAEHLGAEFWSADRRLIAVLHAQGISWAYQLEEA